jgi:hypothetical protein
MWIDTRPPTSDTNSSPNYGSYEDFITTFNENYKPTDTRRTAMDQLDSLKQGNLPANEFVTKFKLLARQAGLLGTTPGTASDPADMLLRSKFQGAMNQPLWLKISTEQAPPTTLEEWCTQAIVRDDQWRTAQRRTLNVRGFRAFGKGRPTTSTNRVTVNRLTPEQLEEARKKGLCFFCGVQGHRANDCPTKPARSKPKTLFKKKEGRKPSATQAFASIKNIVADMEPDQLEELEEQMNELDLSSIDNTNPF